MNALRHGAYLCLSAPHPAIPALAARLGFQNEFDSSGGDPPEAFALLRRVSTIPRDLPDDDLAAAEAIVHVASASAERVLAFCAEAARLTSPRVLRGAVLPMTYTGAAMHAYAYEGRVTQRSGAEMPNAFLVAMNKTAAWWAKDWMERHTYFLPRYDDEGRMRSEGHALAAAAGIPCMMRRTYKCTGEPYEFLNYFECADADVPTFHAVCARLRDVAKNPEWAFVREGPTWCGRRVRSWD
jgi:hypothetical protein